MDNTELKLIPLPDLAYEYYASPEGDIYKKMLGRPRNNGRRSIILKRNEKYYRMLKGMITGKDKRYLRVDLEHKYKSQQIHRLILLTFNPHPDQDRLQVNHINRNTFDNSLKNLEWCDNRHNANHRLSTVDYGIEKGLQEYLSYIEMRIQNSYFYEAQKNGSWLQKYDKELICHLLQTTDLTKKEIAEVAKCSHRAVRYYQELSKFKRPRQRLIEEITPTVIKLREEGLNLYAIADETGLTYSAVRNIWVKNLSVTTIERDIEEIST